MATNPVAVLMDEERKIDSQIHQLSEQRDAIRNAREVISHASGFQIHQGGSTTKTAPAKRTKRGGKRTKKARGPQQLTLRGVKNPKPRSLNGRGQTTMSMARTVIDNADKELQAEEVRKAIVDTFGKTPAESLTQMLYKRARAGSSFYRTVDGKYGLLEWRRKQQKAA